jgi:hypothetical protein
MINRRKFFTAIGKAVLGTAIALQIPDNIIPKLETITEVYPRIIEDWFFTDSPFLARIRETMDKPSKYGINC